MNYRHEFHAGNFADLMKHTLLVILLQAMNRKSAAWCYLDTHAGAGCYDLKSKAAGKSTEARSGIGRLWSQADDAPAPVKQLCGIVASFNARLAKDSVPRFYPGSPCIAAALARSQDRLVLAELHPQEHRALHDRFREDSRAAVHARDGYEMLKALVPPSQRRGLVLMDPPFERADEFDAQLQSLCEAHQRWSGGVYALWYPMKEDAAVRGFYRKLLRSGIAPLLAAEFRVAPPAARLFSACGMLVVNPPWQCAVTMQESLQFLATALAFEHGDVSMRWLASAQ